MQGCGTSAINRLATSLDSGDEAAALDAVLSLKTSSAMVGGVRLAELAGELEDAIRAHDARPRAVAPAGRRREWKRHRGRTAAQLQPRGELVRGRREPVPNAADGLEPAGLQRILPQLAPQVADVHFDGTLIGFTDVGIRAVVLDPAPPAPDQSWTGRHRPPSAGHAGDRTHCGSGWRECRPR